MTPMQGAAALRKKGAALKREVKAALNETAKTGVKLGRANSSGLFSLSQLAALGHPYSRRHANPSFDPMLINAQSGRFRAGWQRVSAFSFAGGMKSMIINYSDVAKYLKFGTNRMVRRPVDVLTMIDVEPFFWRNVLGAVRKAIRA